ncbi:MAG: alpha/beta fold hydrolase [Frankiales bacterium]|nr:MAG: alpha/beta fold hydrolase [Frankiales bacterium]
MSTRVAQKQLVDGLTVTEWAGPGPTVFGLPGLGSSGTAWGPLAQSLPDARVLSVDLRGRGEGRHLAGPTGLRAHARDVAAVLAELDLSDVVLVGHSMGAYLAPLVAQEAPGRIRKLVLVDGGIRPAFPFFMGPALTRIAFRRQLGSMDRDWPDIEAVARKAKLDRMLAGRPELRPLVRQMLQDEMERTESGGLRPRVDVTRCAEDAVDTFWGDDVEGALAAVTVPVDLLVAENQKWEGNKPFIADKVIARWRDRLPRLTVQRLPGNHVTVLFAPEVIAAVDG